MDGSFVMDDYLVKAIAKEYGVRCLACVTTSLANEGARRHKTRPTASAVLGLGLTSAALFGALLKIKQRVAIKMSSNGPIQKVVVESNSYGRLRGYVEEPNVELPRNLGRADIAGAMGDEGIVTVAKDIGLKELYQGIVPMVDGSIEQDLLHYLRHSEQVDSFMEIDAILSDENTLEHGSSEGISEQPIIAAGGILIQALPDTDASSLSMLAQRMEEMPSLADQLNGGLRPEDVVAEIFNEIEYDILEKRPLSFNCYCSWSRTEKALLTLGKEEIAGLIQEGEAVIDCHFCGEQYIFGVEALETIMDKL